MYKSLHCR